MGNASLDSRVYWRFHVGLYLFERARQSFRGPLCYTKQRRRLISLVVSDMHERRISQHELGLAVISAQNVLLAILRCDIAPSNVSWRCCLACRRNESSWSIETR